MHGRGSETRIRHQQGAFDARTMIVLVAVGGGLGVMLLGTLFALAPRDPVAPHADALRSLAVAPFEASHDRSLTEPAARLSEALPRALAEGMPYVRVVAGRSGDARFVLEGDAGTLDGEVQLALRVVDARDGSTAGRALVRFGYARLGDTESAVRDAAASARRIVAAAMLRAAAD